MTGPIEFPLTPEQQHSVRHFMGNLGSAEFVNMNSAYRLTGPLNMDALLKSFTALFQRQDALRTVVIPPADSKEAFHRISEDELPQVEIFDLTASGPDGLTRAREIASEIIWRQFAIGTELLTRVFVIKLPADTFVVGIVSHHLISDMISHRVIWKDLAASYKRYCSDTAQLPPPSTKYRDFIVERCAWERDWKSSKNAAFWNRQMQNLKPAEDNTPWAEALRETSGPRPLLELAKDQKAALEQFARGHRVTMFMLVFALFAGALTKSGREKTLSIGIVTDERSREAYADLVGNFSNCCPLAIDAGGDPTFRELLKRVRTSATGLMDNPWMPGEVLRHIASQKIGLHIIDYVNLDTLKSVRFDGIVVEHFELNPPPTKGTPGNVFVFVNRPESFLGVATSQTEELRPHIEEVLGGIQKLITAILKNPDVKVSAALLE